MSLLLDTHALLWWLQDDPRLSPRVREAFTRRDQQLLWSAASTWELAIKSGLGKLTFAKPLRQYIPRVIERERLKPLDIRSLHAAEVESLPPTSPRPLRPPASRPSPSRRRRASDLRPPA